MFMKKIYSFVDIETTGHNATYGKITEIAVVQVSDGVITNKWSTLLNPEMTLSPFIVSLTGITDSMLADAPYFHDIAEELYTLLEGTVFVAHNAQFDYSFLKAEFAQVGMKFCLPSLCTVRLSRKLFPEERKHNLDIVTERMGITIKGRHRALGDAEATALFYLEAKKMFGEEHLNDVTATMLKKYMVPPHVDEAELLALPESAGVYFFYGEDDTLLYVGKSINIKERVFSHFSKAHDSPKELTILRELRRVEYTLTSSEMSALLLEARLVKERMPVYNRKLRHGTKALTLIMEHNADGYITPIQKSLTDLTDEEFPKILGIFSSKRHLTDTLDSLHGHYNLCKKLLGVTKEKGTCFGHELGRCRGACGGHEIPLQYNARMLEAFHKHKVLSWPWEQPIMIEEVSQDKQRKETFVIDRWALLKVIRMSEADGYEEEIFEPIFDHDIYMILKRYLTDPVYRRKIKVLEKETMTSY